jgi:hypothetical protein
MTQYSTAIDRDSMRRFEEAAAKALGSSGLSFEEREIRHLVNIQVGDVNSNASSPFKCLVMQFAADDVRNTATPFGPKAASQIRRNQSPILDGSNKIPGSLAMGIFGVSAHVVLSGTEALVSSTLIAAVDAVQKTLENSVLTLKQGDSLIYEVGGPDFMNYGKGQRVDGATLNTVASAINTPFNEVAHGHKLIPVVMGSEQEIVMEHVWDRTTLAVPAAALAWPLAFQILYRQPAVIARKR